MKKEVLVQTRTGNFYLYRCQAKGLQGKITQRILLLQQRRLLPQGHRY